MTVVAIYARKSTEDERSAEDGRSVERQREHGIAFAEQRGWMIAEPFVYVDDGISGAEFANRPGLTRLLQDVRRTPRPFDAVIVMDQSRLGRDTIRTLALIQAIQDAGVRIYGYLDGREITVGSEMGEVESFMKSWADSKVRRDGSKRVRDALARKARLGHVTGSHTFGYQLLRVNDHTERRIDEAQAAVVRRVFELAAQGYGDTRIMHALAADGVPAPGPKGWSKDIVRRMLQNEVYVGRAIFGKKRTVDKNGSVGKTERVSPDEWIRADVPHLRIIADELWKTVQARKATTRAHYLRDEHGHLLSRPESGLVARHILNGIARCWSCGGALVGIGQPRKGERPRYRCVARLRRGASYCPNGSGVLLDDLNEAVRVSLFDLLANQPDVVAALVEERDARLRAEQATQGDRREAALREAAELEEQIGRLVLALAHGQGSPDVVAAINERRARVEELKATPAPPPRFDRAEFLRRFAGVRRIAMLLEPSYPAQVRQVIRKLGVDKIVVQSDGTFEGVADLGNFLTTDAPPSGNVLK